MLIYTQTNRSGTLMQPERPAQAARSIRLIGGPLACCRACPRSCAACIRSHIFAVLPKACAKRIAISAVTGARHSQIAARSCSSTRRCAAASAMNALRRLAVEYPDAYGDRVEELFDVLHRHPIEGDDDHD